MRSTGTSRPTPRSSGASARGWRPNRVPTGSHIKGGRGGGTPGRDTVAKSRRPPGGGGAGGEGLGRSRGGFTTKLHPSADGRCRPLSLIVTPGQRADCAQFKPVLEKVHPKIGTGRPRKKPDSIAADKAYSNRPCREYLRYVYLGTATSQPSPSDSGRDRPDKS
ncbi:transposase [Streptomyces nigra]|uniref:transposase n=1 Tax=Streptomyces nigra TaxID=1827580 RepID=UPI0037D23B01